MPRFLHAVAVWVLILGIAAVAIYVPHRPDPEVEAFDSAPTNDPGHTPSQRAADTAKTSGQEAVETSDSQVEDQISSSAQLRGRLLVVSQSMTRGNAPLPGDLILGDEPLDRLASAILLMHFGNPAQAYEQIDLAEEGFDVGDSGGDVSHDKNLLTSDNASNKSSDKALVNATRAAMIAWPEMIEAADGTGTLKQKTQLTKEQFELLQQRLGWFGTYAQAQISDDDGLGMKLQESDMTFMLVLGFATIWFLGFGAFGITALIALIVMGLRRKIGSVLKSQSNTSLILGETFVVWFALFLGLQFMAMLLHVDPESPQRLVLSGVLMFAALGALAWARWRGLSFGTILDLVGLRWNQGFFQLLWKAVIAYTCALPLMGLGLLIGMGMGWFLNVPNLGNPTHPIQQLIQNASGMELFMLFALACIAAPITEEIVFRGVLYGHLRQGTSKWGVAASMIFSMVISGVIFAGIHPQGAFVAPALAGLACGFCITREWSGSVFPGMIAHGIQNATVLALNVILFQA